MKIAEARKVYSAQIKAYHEQHTILSKQKKELEVKMKTEENGSIIYANEAATLELNIPTRMETGAGRATPRTHRRGMRPDD